MFSKEADETLVSRGLRKVKRKSGARQSATHAHGIHP